jgi:hypothetical protein
LSIDKQASNTKAIISKVDSFLAKKQSEARKFVLSYLKYLLNQDLDNLNMRLLELVKNAEQNKPIQCQP